MSTTDYQKETAEAVHESVGQLLAAHGHEVSSPAAGVEGLDRAACSAHITGLARLAMGASSEGVTAEQWRSWLRDAIDGQQADVVLRAAEHCMRANGLWPWPDQA